MSKKTIGLLLFVVAAMALALVPTASASNGVRTYTVTITNDTGGQPMTPPLASTHKQNAGVFGAGEQATFGVQQIAENGNLEAAIAEREGNNGVADFVIGFPVPEMPGPLHPGETTTFEITSTEGANRFSFVAMLVCTNDGFTGVDSVKLPKNVGD
ncbi:MAG: spondin domain-containing protein, partial [Acidimicrobiia bacterium]|nr:spondin domain-containing protein [Acidimicrobiia bacterium]